MDIRGSIAFVTMTLLSVHAATAQEPCLLYQRGTVACPDYSAPAATAVPGPSIDGSIATVPNGVSTTLFKGAVPANGFMIRVFASNLGGQNNSYGYSSGSAFCFVNDNGPASFGGGIYIIPDAINYSGTFETPFGYKPIGTVSIWCQIPQGIVVYIAARGW